METTTKIPSERGTHIASRSYAMRTLPWLWALGLWVALGVPRSADAQTTTTASLISFDQTMIIRSGSPRVTEQSLMTPLQPTSPIGQRDCECETWSFKVDIGTLPAGSNASVSFWVGLSAPGDGSGTSSDTSCLNTTFHFPAASATCWQITQVSAQAVASNQIITVTIPSVLLVDPLFGTCSVPLPGASNTVGTVFLFALLSGVSTTTSTGIPGDAVAISYSLTGPDAPTGVTSTPGDTQAQVNWTAAGTLSIGADASETGFTTGVTTPNLAGYWVLCFPLPQGLDAGVGGGVCGSDAGIIDVTGQLPAPDASEDTFIPCAIPDASDGAMEASAPETGVDAAVSDIGTEASFADVSTGVGACLTSLPANFDPNNETFFDQAVCSGSTIIGTSTGSFTVNGLVNGTNYAFAVVAEDTAGNRTISSLATASDFLGNPASCVQPMRVISFWDHYVQEGGQAQPGVFCDVQLGTVGVPGSLLLAFAALALILLLRRRRSSPKDGASP